MIYVGAAIAVGSITLWPELSPGRSALVLLGSLALASLAGLACFVASYNPVTENDLCGRDGGSFGDAWSIPTALAYLGAGAAAFTSPRRLMWGWPLSVLLGFAVLVGLAALFLGGGTCET